MPAWTCWAVGSTCSLNNIGFRTYQTNMLYTLTYKDRGREWNGNGNQLELNACMLAPTQGKSRYPGDGDKGSRWLGYNEIS